MAHTAITDPEYAKERFDAPDVLESKLSHLVRLVQEAERVVVFTGAGISTSAGIPSFRGPDGVWTLLAEGRTRTAATTDSLSAIPTRTHMAIVSLLRHGNVSYVVSQNGDGLHRRSGVPARCLSELHGNSNCEICEDCGRQFFRDYKCTRRGGRVRDHWTGRACATCGGRLLSYTIDFEQELPGEPLQRAVDACKTADLHIVLGSSLIVSPACDLPRTTQRHGGRMVICNLQKTPLSEEADLHVYAPCDYVMTQLLERLNVSLCSWRLRRRIVVDWADSRWSCRGVDVDTNTEESLFSRVVWTADGREEEGPSTPGDAADLWHVRALFFGHYNEPPMVLSIDGSKGTSFIFDVSFDPLSGGTWAIDEERVEAVEVVDPPRIPSYGSSHKRYVDAAGQGMTSSQPAALIGADPSRGFQANPLTHCDHAYAHVCEDLTFDDVWTSACTTCNEATLANNGNEKGLGMCLTCGVICCIAASSCVGDDGSFVSRHLKGHMVQHSRDTGHALALGLEDLTFWCHSCRDYLDNYTVGAIKPTYRKAHEAKFGESPPAL